MFVDAILPVARRRLFTLPDTALLIEAAAALKPGVDLVVICEAGGAAVGVVTKTDVVARISQCEGASCTCAVVTVMTRDVLTCGSLDDLMELWSQMKQRGIKNVPVVDEQRRPLGIANARDALQALLKETADEENILRDYVMGFGYR